MEKINYNEQFKIRLRLNASVKHETIKLLLVRQIKEKYKRDLNHIIVYTEYQVSDNKICDIYFENRKTGDKIYYEIQNNESRHWVSETLKEYEKLDGDLNIISEKSLPDDIFRLNKALREYIL